MVNEYNVDQFATGTMIKMKEMRRNAENSVNESISNNYDCYSVFIGDNNYVGHTGHGSRLFMYTERNADTMLYDVSVVKSIYF